MKRLVLIVVLALSAACFAQNVYYIDYARADNTGNGLTKGTAWKTHPAMGTCAGTVTAPTYTPHSGSAQDKFLFKGGVVWPAACFQMYISQAGLSSGSKDYYGIESSGGIITWFDAASSEPGCATPSLVIKNQDADGKSWNKTLTLRTTCQPVFDGANQFVNANLGLANGVMVWARADHLDFDNLEIRRNQLAYGIDGATALGSMLQMTEHADVVTEHLDLHDVKLYKAALASISKSGSTVTVVCQTACLFQNGTSPSVVIQGVGNASLDGTHCADGVGCLVAVSDSTHMTFTASDSATVGAITNTGYIMVGLTNNAMISAWSTSDLQPISCDSCEVENSAWNNNNNSTTGAQSVNFTRSFIHDVASNFKGGSTFDGGVISNVSYCAAGGHCAIYDGIAHTNGFYLVGAGVSPDIQVAVTNTLIYNFGANAAQIFPNLPEGDLTCTANGAGVGVHAYFYNNIIEQGAAPASCAAYIFDIGTTTGASSCNDIHIWNNIIQQNTTCAVLRLGLKGTCIGPSCKAVTLFEYQNNQTITSDGAPVLSYNAATFAYCATCNVDHNLNQTTAAATAQGYSSAGNYAPIDTGGSTYRAGVDLTSAGVMALDTAYLGNARPNGSAWDIGAYMLGGAAPTCTLTASPAVIKLGTSSTLTFTPANTPTGCSIDNGVGAVSCSGATPSVSPTTLTTYTATVTNAGGTNTCSASVTIGGTQQAANTIRTANTVTQ